MYLLDILDFRQFNIFRYLADISHLVSVCILLYKMLTRKSCNGVSFRTQLLYLVVFVTRYVNHAFFSPPTYNIIFKIFYISSEALICILMITKLKKTYEARHDTFQIQIIMILAAVLAVFTTPYTNYYPRFTRRWWYYFFFAYSLWVESVAILPQLFLLRRSKKIDVLNIEYIFFLSIYRLFYILNWIYKIVYDTNKTPIVVWITGIIQTVVYSDFIYSYIRMRITGKEFSLPY